MILSFFLFALTVSGQNFNNDGFDHPNSVWELPPCTLTTGIVTHLALPLFLECLVLFSLNTRCSLIGQGGEEGRWCHSLPCQMRKCLGFVEIIKAFLWMAALSEQYPVVSVKRGSCLHRTWAGSGRLCLPLQDGICILALDQAGLMQLCTAGNSWSLV